MAVSVYQTRKTKPKFRETELSLSLLLSESDRYFENITFASRCKPTKMNLFTPKSKTQDNRIDLFTDTAAILIYLFFCSDNAASSL